MQKYEKQFEPYAFLGWLTHFVSLREDTRNNIPTAGDTEKFGESSSDGFSDDDGDITDCNEKTSDCESIAAISSSTTSKLKRKIPPEGQLENQLKRNSFQSGPNTSFKNKTSTDSSRSASKYVTEKRAKKPSVQEDANTAVLKAISKRLSEKSATRENDRRDEDEDFGKMVATELKGLPKVFKIKLKHEINNLIFQYQMANLQHEPVNHQNQTQLSKETGMPSPVNNSITTPPSTNKSTYFHNSGGRSFQFYSGNNPYDASVSDNSQWS